MTAFTTARALAASFSTESFLAEVEAGDYLATSIFEAEVATFERLWALSDAELVQELAEIREGQRAAADDRDWDEYEGYEVARYEVYAVQTNREALADEADLQARVGAPVQEHLTYRPFAALQVA